MRKLRYSDFAIQTGKLDARLILSCLLFSYPSIIQHSTVQKYPAYHTLLEKHGFQCIVRVISAARSRFENTSPAHSANFENGMETGLNVLFSYDDRSSFFSLPYSASEI